MYRPERRWLMLIVCEIRFQDASCRSPNAIINDWVEFECVSHVERRINSAPNRRSRSQGDASKSKYILEKYYTRLYKEGNQAF